MASSDSLIGSVLDGKYQVDRLLGRGGMGEVYAGTHLRLERAVAIKVLHGDLTDNESFVARFAREARTAAKLEHPNAVHVYDFGALADGSTYLVMEYIDGVTLRHVLRANGRLEPCVAVDLIRQAAAAVGAAHARGIVHRDIKPENMMVREDETGRLLLKVVDFGLAKMLENTTSQLTNKSELMGTPKYMAPEQFQGTTVDGRVDVYALGCVLFEMVAGRAPFEGTFIEIVGKHVYAEIPMVADLGVEIPESLENAIRRALAKDPGGRTASAADFAIELEGLSGELPAATAPITMPVAKPPVTAGAAESQVVTAHARQSDSVIDDGPTIRADVATLDADADPLRTRRSLASDTPGGTSARPPAQPTVLVPDAAAGTNVIPASRATRRSTNAAEPAAPAVAALDNETVPLPTRVVTPPPFARRPAWLVPGVVGLAGVVVVGGVLWNGAGSPVQPPVSNSVAPLPVAAPVTNTPARDLVEPVSNEPIQVEEPAGDPGLAPEPEPDVAEPPAPRSTPKPPGARVNAEPVPEPPVAEPPKGEVRTMEPAQDPSTAPGLTPAERRRLRKLYERIERERRRREAQKRPGYQPPPQP